MSRRRLALIAAVPALAVVVVLAANAVVLAGGRGEAPRHAQAALVLGALVHADGTPSAMVEDRVQTAARLYRDRRVDKVLVSGDHGTPGYDEVGVMRKRLLALGVAPADVFTDHAGFDTWQSAVRARKVFDVDDAIVVTQRFHLARAVWLARRAGIEAGGVAADRSGGYGRKGTVAGVREWLARVKAVPSGVLHTKPRFLGPEIPIAGDGRSSWGPATPGA